MNIEQVKPPRVLEPHELELAMMGISPVERVSLDQFKREYPAVDDRMTARDWLLVVAIAGMLGLALCAMWAVLGML